MRQPRSKECRGVRGIALLLAAGIAIAVSTSCRAAEKAPEETAGTTQAKAPGTEVSPERGAPAATIEALLADSTWISGTREYRWRALAKARLGTPYALGCLGEEDENDADPVFRLDQADCTVLVLTNSALVRAANVSEARDRLVEIHYRDGAPSYASRIHFTSDRITNSPWFADITPSVAPASRLVPVSLTLNRRENGERLLPIDWERPLTISYLPSAAFDSTVAAALPPVAGVAFLNEKNTRLGFLVSHEGILFDGRTLHHASSMTDEVSNTDLREYLFAGRDEPRFDGMLFYELK